MPRTLSIHGLRELLDEQLAVASRGQLLALGMNDRAMQYRLRPDGPWQALLPGIYLAVTGTPTFEQKEITTVPLRHEPGSLAKASRQLAKAGINIESVLLLGMQGNDIEVGFVTSDPVMARNALAHAGSASG